MFSGGQLKAPETTSPECSQPGKCRVDAGLPSACVPVLGPALSTALLPSSAQNDPTWAQQQHRKRSKQSGMECQMGNGAWDCFAGGLEIASTMRAQETGVWLGIRDKKQRPEEEPKTGNEMRLVLGQSHSGEQWGRSQDQIGNRCCGWGPKDDAAGRSSKAYVNYSLLPLHQEWISRLLTPMGICEISWQSSSCLTPNPAPLKEDDPLLSVPISWNSRSSIMEF